MCHIRPDTVGLIFLDERMHLYSNEQRQPSHFLTLFLNKQKQYFPFLFTSLLSLFNSFCLSIFHFPLNSLSQSLPSTLSLSLAVSHAAVPDFPRAGWTVVECVLLTFTRGQETQPPGRETRERERERGMSQRGQGGTYGYRGKDHNYGGRVIL